jgi:hypothetical protein
MERIGYRLTEEYEAEYLDWDDAPCTCHCGHPPCSSCTHPGHEICLEETPEAWEPDYLSLVPAGDML